MTDSTSLFIGEQTGPACGTDFSPHNEHESYRRSFPNALHIRLALWRVSRETWVQSGCLLLLVSFSTGFAGPRSLGGRSSGGETAAARYAAPFDDVRTRDSVPCPTLFDFIRTTNTTRATVSHGSVHDTARFFGALLGNSSSRAFLIAAVCALHDPVRAAMRYRWGRGFRSRHLLYPVSSCTVPRLGVDLCRLVVQYDSGDRVFGGSAARISTTTLVLFVALVWCALLATLASWSLGSNCYQYQYCTSMHKPWPWPTRRAFIEQRQKSWLPSRREVINIPHAPRASHARG